MWDNHIMQLIELDKKAVKRATRRFRNILSPELNVGPPPDIGVLRCLQKDVFEISVPLSV